MSGTGTQGGWTITSYFGGRIDPLTGRAGSHGGQDLAYAGCSGTPIYAPCDGYVAQAWDSSGGGNWTSLTAADGSYFGFGHASSFAPGVNGKNVKAGTVLAYVGTTGGSTGAHLHFAYRPPKSNAYADPFNLLEAVKNTFVGDEPAPIPEQPAEKIPEEIDMTKEEFQKAADAWADRAISEIKSSNPDPNNIFLARHELTGGIYLVVNNVKYHIGTPDQVRVLEAVGTRNAQNQGALLDSLPEGKF